MRPVPTRVTVVGNHRVEAEYADGLRATLDFAAYLAQRSGPIIDSLITVDGFGTVRIGHGALTWATGFDICPDVLRFWCDRGRICSPDEMEAFFASRRPVQASSGNSVITATHVEVAGSNRVAPASRTVRNCTIPAMGSSVRPSPVPSPLTCPH